MPRPRRTPVEPTLSDATVEAGSGKTWRQWFELLDAAGAEAWDHKTTVAHLREGYGVPHWWQQTIAVSYQRARGLRDKHEQADGYEIQRQKTVRVPAEAAYRAWLDEELRRRWLPEADKARPRSVREKPLFVRLDWPDGRTRVLLGMRPKGPDKCDIGVQQSKLPSADEAERAKEFWAEKLTVLKGLLEA